MYKESKWAKEIISLQDENGSWGFFHGLSDPNNKKPLSTEQSLRRLYILGYTINDVPIQKAVSYINDCLSGKQRIPDGRDTVHDDRTFKELMLATWIRIFTKDNPLANKVANVWANVIKSAFNDGEYSHPNYISAYESAFGMKPRGDRCVDFVSFYQIVLVADQFDEKIESAVFDYILNHKDGIFYIYDRPKGNAFLSVLPDEFASSRASRYLGAMELLSDYRRSTHKLKFACDWIMKHRNENNKWDLGSSVNTKVYFPLSDSWKNMDMRESDCTYRIEKLLASLNYTV